MRGEERLVTAEEFAQIPDDDHRYELVGGRVVRMSPPGSRHAVLATRVAVLLSHHIDQRGLGAVMTAGGFKLATNPDTVREPDVAFVRGERISGTGVPDGFWPGPPISPSRSAPPAIERPKFSPRCRSTSIEAFGSSGSSIRRAAL
jgi:Uma2 family endonuclease